MMAEQKQQDSKKVISRTLNAIHGIRLTRALRDLRKNQQKTDYAKNEQPIKK